MLHPTTPPLPQLPTVFGEVILCGVIEHLCLLDGVLLLDSLNDDDTFGLKGDFCGMLGELFLRRGDDGVARLLFLTGDALEPPGVPSLSWRCLRLK